MELRKHIAESFPEPVSTRILASLGCPAPNGLLLNEEKMSVDTLLGIYPSLARHPYVPNGFLFDRDALRPGRSVYHALGAFYIQDPSSMMPAYLLSPRPYERLLDVSSAPGGKMVQAALLMKGRGTIIANDVSRSRLNEELSNIERMGVSNAILTNFDFLAQDINRLGKFDCIILDAPCSGSGMIRKDPKMEADWSLAKVNKFASMQKAMLHKAYSLLSPGGRIGYSTCSLSREENEDVVMDLLTGSDAEIVDLKLADDAYIDGKCPIGVHFLPGIFAGEGQYSAIIKKPGPERRFTLDGNESFLLREEELKDRFRMKFGDDTFSLPEKDVLRGVPIVRYGLKETEANGVLSHHLAHALSSYHLKAELDEEELAKYLHGDVLPHTERGFVLLTYKSIPLGWGKGDGKIIKNHYPKGLRGKAY